MKNIELNSTEDWKSMFVVHMHPSRMWNDGIRLWKLTESASSQDYLAFENPLCKQFMSYTKVVL